MTWPDLVAAVIVLLIGGVIIAAGSPLIVWVLRRVDRQLAQAELGGDAETIGITAAKLQLRGGTWIGMLERVAVYASILAHFPEAIGMVLLVKGLARYPELQATTRGAAERFIIGTFVSVLLACAGAGVAWYLVGLVR